MMAELMTSRNAALIRLEEEHDAHFTWDAEASTWCLSGPYRAGMYDEDGPYWETDDVPAGTFEQAEERAIAYLHLARAHTVIDSAADDGSEGSI